MKTRTSISRPILSILLILGIAVQTISCNDNNDPNTGGTEISSSSVGADNNQPSSSSNEQSSSSGGGTTQSSSSVGGTQSSKIEGTPVPYEGKTYKTVIIGDQTWFAENLDYEVGNSKCYDDDTDNCDIYGRLYEWVTAMDLPEECRWINSTNDTDCTINEPHKGICPTDWHIPSYEEWTTLIDYVASNDYYDYYGVEPKLKATSGWEDRSNGRTGNGTDDYGFAALPGSSPINEGCWWSNTENGTANNAGVNVRCISSFNGNQIYSISNKSKLLSVRCIKDTNP